MLLELGCLLLNFGSMLCHRNFEFVNKFKCWYSVLDGVQNYDIVYAFFWGAIFDDFPHSRKEKLCTTLFYFVGHFCVIKTHG